MNEEIKEILESLDKIAKSEYYPEDLLYYENCKILLDYITNLQQENDDLKNRLENEVADNNLRLKELTTMIRDDERSQETIIRLSKENERLQENNQNMQEEMCRCWQRIDKLTNNWNELEEWVKQRIDKVKYNSYDDILDKMKEIKENNEKTNG